MRICYHKRCVHEQVAKRIANVRFTTAREKSVFMRKQKNEIVKRIYLCDSPEYRKKHNAETMDKNQRKNKKWRERIHESITCKWKPARKRKHIYGAA